MIVRDREPLVYYAPAPANEWAGAVIVFASAMVALFFIMLYYFTALNNDSMQNMPAPTTVIEQPIPAPSAVPQPILIPTPQVMPQPSVPSPRSLAKPIPAQLAPRVGESIQPAPVEAANNNDNDGRKNNLTDNQ